MQDISISLIRYFVTLVDKKQFVKAAEFINISQPALSKSIKTLESQLGVKLLKRLPKGFELTDEGEYFYETSSYLLNLYDDFLYNISDRIASPYSGTVRLSVPGAITEAIMPQLLDAFWKKYPEINIAIRGEDSETSIASLIDGKADFILAVAPIPATYAGVIKYIPVFDSSYHVVFPESHPFNDQDSIHIKELDKQHILLPGESSRIRRVILDTFSAQGIVPKLVLSCSHFGFLLSSVQMGRGVAVLPKLLLTDDNMTGLSSRPLEPSSIWQLGILSRNNGFFSLAAQCAYNFFLDYLCSLGAK